MLSFSSYPYKFLSKERDIWKDANEFFGRNYGWNLPKGSVINPSSIHQESHINQMQLCLHQPKTPENLHCPALDLLNYW